MDPIRNPYAPGAGQRPPELAGRDEQLAAFEVVLERVAKGRPERSLVLTGLRGVGKTVLLNALRGTAVRKGWGTGKLEARLRKQHDKRFSRRGARRISAAEVPDHVPGAATLNGNGQAVHEEDTDGVPTKKIGSLEVKGEGPLVVREKTHVASPMTLDQALYEMELVGHDFYLFVDKENDRPAVVYRRRGYDYGVISLDVGAAE